MRGKGLKLGDNYSNECGINPCPAGRRIELDNNNIDGFAINNAEQVHTRRRIEFFLFVFRGFWLGNIVTAKLQKQKIRYQKCPKDD